MANKSKREQAKEVFINNPGLARKEMLVKFVAACGLTTAGASTYYAAIKKEVAGGTVAPKAKPKAKSVKAPKAKAKSTKNIVKYLKQKNFMQTMLKRPELAVPMNFEATKSLFSMLSCDLSPENLCCDGEASLTYVRQQSRMLNGAWAELEAIAGRTVTESEALHWS